MEVIAAFVNGLSLLVITAWIFIEAVQRFFAPVEVRSKEMFVIATIGLLANLFIAVILNGHAGENLNVKSAFLHVIGDAAASLGVIVAGFLMLRFRWYLADPLISVAVSLVIVRGAYRLVRETVHILMEGSPRDLHREEIVTALGKVPGVKNVHDLHAWNISYNIPSVSMHIIVDPEFPDYQEVLDRCNLVLAKDFGIFHSTIQLECRCRIEGEMKCSLVAGKKCSGHVHGHHDHHGYHEHA
jgi:cobalt-zinc-cadmium efflux system protein